MTRPARRQRPSLAITLLAALVLGAMPATAPASEAKSAFRDGETAMARGEWDWAVIYMQKAVDLKPENPEYRKQLQVAKNQASFAHFEVAKKHLAAGNLEPAISELQQVINLNPTHQYAHVELERALAAWKKQQESSRAEVNEIEEMKSEADAALAAVPKLDPSSNIAIQFQLENKTTKEIFAVIKDVTGINCIFDDGVDLNKPTSLVTDNVTLEDALDLFMLQNGLTYKVYNDRTILVYQNNQTKQREYEDQFIRTFYLSNADVKEVNAILRSVIDLRKTAVNEQLNAITIRDSQDKIAIAGKLIEANDKAKAELVIDLEVLEVNRKKLKKYGIDVRTGESGGLNSTIAFDDDQVRLNNLDRLGQLGSYILSPIPSATLSLLRQDSDTRTVSRPQVRVTDGERVTVHLGDQVPIPNTTFNTSNTVGGNVVPITSYTYQNTGIQIELEPRIHHNREITLKLQTEISAVGSVSESGQPTIGTREVETVIRLRDGETNLLAGLFAELVQNSSSGLPLLSTLPGLRHVFGANSKTGTESEIILTVTPHIVRIPDISLSDLVPLQVGTERDTKLKGVTLYGVGGSPFRKPDDRPPEDLFSTLRPGEKGTSRETLTVPDVALAAGTEQGSTARPPLVVNDLLLQQSGGGGEPQGGAAEPGGAGTPAPAGQGGPGATSGAAGGAASGGAASGGGASGGSASGSGSSGGSSGGTTGRSGGGGGATSGGVAGASPAPAPPRSPGQPAGPARLSFQTSRDGLRVGERTTVEIRLDSAGNEVAHAPYHVLFDASALRIVSAVEGDYFRSAGTSTTFIPNIGPGRLIIGHSQLGSASGVASAGTLAVVTFEAVGPGETTLTFDRVALANGQNEAVSTQAGSLFMRVTR